MKIKKEIVFIIFMLFIFVFNMTTVHAFTLDNIIQQGNNFKGDDAGIGAGISGFIHGSIKPIVSLVGNLIFAAITVILGAKYIWSGVEGKSQVKETLPVFVASVIFFYLATEITALFDPTTSSSIAGSIGSINKAENLAGMIIGTINTIVRFASVGGVVFIGLKYMFESAEGKANIKDRLTPMALGIVLVFCASSFVDAIINSGYQLIK